MSDPRLLAEIDAEAERIREDGTLPPGFEQRCREVFGAITSRRDELAERARALPVLLARSDRLAELRWPRAAELARRGVSPARRRVGPALRVLQRGAVERATRSSERVSTTVQVLGERVQRAASRSVPGRVARFLVTEGTRTALLLPPHALRIGRDGHLGDAELDAFLVERIEGCRPGAVLVLAANAEALVTRLVKLDVSARFAEEHDGSLAALARQPAGSLAGVVVAGAVDHVTPARARALSRLAADKLEPGGRLVLLATHPGPRVQADPIASDLSSGRALHPVTWCHLFARLGLEGISVRESTSKAAYAIAAERPGAQHRGLAA